MKTGIFAALFFLLFSFCSKVDAQAKKDSIKITSTAAVTDSLSKKKKVFNPRVATIRSAILPGLGQIYNRKYWKLPLVYGALGTTAGVYFFNINTYRSLKQAYIYLTDKDSTNDGLVDPQLKNLSTSAIRSYRDSYRQNIDYSVLFFILFWGLNIVDATVDAHLKAFDVNDDLSLQLKAGYSPMANTSGISLVINIGKRNTAR